jgi:penicillin-binding protein 1C
MSGACRKKKIGRVLALVGIAAVLFFMPSLPGEYRDLRADSSVNLTDRSGVPLRRNLSSREGVNSWVALEDIPSVLQRAVLTAEDKRFYYHPGSDPIAIARATRDNIQAGTVVSGASTITQQLLRTLSPPTDRSFKAKIRELYWAVRVECLYSKDEIFEAYLNRVAFGPSVYGVEEASRYYFDKPASALSPAECAALAVTIRSPSVLDPFAQEGTEELGLWTAPLLDRLQSNGDLTEDAATRAKSQILELSRKPPPFLAPHFCDLAQKHAHGSRGRVATTLDLELQKTVEGAVRTHLDLLAEHKVGNAAVIVAEVESGEILALVGSEDYHRREDGQHNAAVSLRQPGSTIKPFTYALLMESTGHAGFILPDLDLYEDSRRDSFVPINYDKHFHGPVSIRTALGCSYNVPAVRALERVGTEALLDTLRKVGLEDLQETPEYYGLGLTLGDGSTSLLQMVAAYRVFAQGGSYSPLTLLPRNPVESDRVLSERTSYLVNSVLSDRQARIASFGTPNVLEFSFPVAVKTGTSKGYRDNWTIGYTPKHIVGVWVGNSDGSPMQDVSGITGAGPLFRDIMLQLGDGGDFERPDGLRRVNLCTLSGQIANDDCPSTMVEPLFEEKQPGTCQVCQTQNGKLVYEMPSLYRPWAIEHGLPAPQHDSLQDDELRFVFPLAHDVFLTDPDLNLDYQRVKLKIAGGTPPYRWSIDGERVAETEAPFLWWELNKGQHSVVVIDSAGTERKLPLSVLGEKKSPG